MIDLSYKVTLHFESDFSKMVVLLTDDVKGLQTYTFKVSSDVISVKIKDWEKFPYMKISKNAIVIDKS